MEQLRENAEQCCCLWNEQMACFMDVVHISTGNRFQYYQNVVKLLIKTIEMQHVWTVETKNILWWLQSSEKYISEN